MIIRRSDTADLDRIMKIYEHARRFMAEHDNPHQWGPTNWPPADLIRSDIADGSSYVCVHEDRIVGIEWAFNQCNHLRMDTHGDNYVMQNLLKKNGFVHCGTIYVEEDSYPRLAYEKSGSVSVSSKASNPAAN